MERVISGIRATGDLHIGNYLGAIRNFAPLQEEHECFFFVADFHTLTSLVNVAELKKFRIPIVKTFLATGIDPSRSHIYLQSDVPEVAELMLLLSMVVGVNELDDCTTYRDMKKNQPDNINAGLYMYPVLMAADILLQKATIVPVGKDQLQHIEMARHFAEDFNKRYGKEIFPIPQASQHREITVKGLDGNKMGKSVGNTITLLESLDSLQNKLSKALTDTNKLRLGDKGTPQDCGAIFPLYDSLFTENTHPVVIEVLSSCSSGARSCADCKKELAKHLYDEFAPIRERYESISDNDVQEVLHEGALVARRNAQSTIAEVRSAMGLS